MDKSVTSESKVQPNSCLLFPDLTDSAVYGPFREALLEVALYICLTSLVYKVRTAPAVVIKRRDVFA